MEHQEAGTSQSNNTRRVDMPDDDESQMSWWGDDQQTTYVPPTPAITNARHELLRQKVREAYQEVLACDVRLLAFKEEIAKSDFKSP